MAGILTALLLICFSEAKAAENSLPSLVGITQARVTEETAESDLVQIDALTGTATFVSSVPIAAGGERPGIDALDRRRGRFFFLRAVGSQTRLLAVDTTSGQLLVESLVTTPVLHLGFDPGNGALFGIAAGDEFENANLVEFSTSGEQRVLRLIRGEEFGRFEDPGVDAVDPATGRFFVTTRTSEGTRRLLTIDTRTGQVTSNVLLPRRLLHMAFSSTRGDLVAITELTPGTQRTGSFDEAPIVEGFFNDLVRIDPATGVETVLSTIGTPSQGFSRPGVDAADSNTDLLFVTRSLPESDELLTIDMNLGAVQTGSVPAPRLTHLSVRASGIPEFSGQLVAAGSVGTRFLATLTATGIPAPVITVGQNFVASLVSQTTSGDTTTAVLSILSFFPGDFIVPLIATNANGSTVANMQVSIISAGFFQPPVFFGTPGFLSSPVAFGSLNRSFNFPVRTSGATDTSVQASQLPNGLRMDGNVINGTPTEAGTFTVLLTATSAGGTAQQDLTIVISSDTDTPESSPPQAIEAPAPFQPVFVGAEVRVELNFTASGRDALNFSGIVDVPRGFTLEGQAVVISVGAVQISGVTDRSAKVRSGENRIRLRRRPAVLGGDRVLVQASRKRASLANQLAPVLPNGTAQRDVRTIPVGVTIGETTVSGSVDLLVNGVAGQRLRARTP